MRKRPRERERETERHTERERERERERKTEREKERKKERETKHVYQQSTRLSFGSIYVVVPRSYIVKTALTRQGDEQKARVRDTSMREKETNKENSG